MHCERDSDVNELSKSPTFHGKCEQVALYNVNSIVVYPVKALRRKRYSPTSENLKNRTRHKNSPPLGSCWVPRECSDTVAELLD